MNTSDRPLILFDPFPRSIAQIFDEPTKKRLESLGNVIWHDGTPASDEYIELHLPEVVALVGQSALPKERLDRAPKLRAVFNVESNFLPNVDYLECHRARHLRAEHRPRLRAARGGNGARPRARQRAAHP